MTSLPQRRAPSRFVELSENECIKLLAEQTVGRIGFMTPDGPQILPVRAIITALAA
jgi:nitroimidazol reductase NimA-like FMN-containing flavoprotein (pyridoxamine 5'-phosphate oxidase superfamily)